jgi:hypothetical protein
MGALEGVSRIAVCDEAAIDWSVSDVEMVIVVRVVGSADWDSCRDNSGCCRSDAADTPPFPSTQIPEDVIRIGNNGVMEDDVPRPMNESR